ncbi:hypothetical protein MF271_17665 (plasmid) [Deinococcus sp. KNUC1210]|uniref:hypothetical protein n=1 Tax=Deinococcus sp. KNUC1210 TaxID=2917691 RepID=UPI001EEFACB8|nr:hypothetical protein [Deinococcus sp. KNUC1210]ULH17007.1 hypothetical protein MF271_17665 [Deinococcus sp. KNUC1210]
MPMLRWMVPVTLSLLVPGAQAAPAAPDPATVKVLSTGYATYLFAQSFRDYCIRQVPSGAAADQQAFSAWAAAQGVTDLEARLSKLLGQETFGALKSSGAESGPQFQAALQKLGPATQVCGIFQQQLAGDAFNLKTKLPAFLVLLKGGSVGTTTSSGSSGKSTTANVAVYSVAQLSTLAGTVINSLPKKTPGDQQTAAVTAKLKSLGTVLVVTGTVPTDRNWLSQEDERHTARWDVRCYDFAEDDVSLSRYKGQRVTVAGTLHDFDLSTFIELSNCRILPSTAGLKTSSLPVGDAGWRFKNQPAEKFLVAAGQGLKDTQILGVYAQQTTGIGVGGMMIQEFDPYLFLKDGTVYNDPYLAPNSFDVKRSRDLEPQKWGRWVRQGKNFQITWGDGDRETFEPQLTGTAAKSGQRLSGSYNHLGGGGNTAMGGDVMVAASSTYTFGSDGRFTGGSSASATTSTVVAGSTHSTAGRYSLSGYNLTLHYDDGGEKRLLFYLVDKDMLHIGGADFLH